MVKMKKVSIFLKAQSVWFTFRYWILAYQHMYGHSYLEIILAYYLKNKSMYEGNFKYCKEFSHVYKNFVNQSMYDLYARCRPLDIS